ncbi:voltage-gated potassium channel [Haladaptatus litoreus]|uniref:Voltage-gated potassium channel n=1 Tax=Haladaptatus litoreus TaxID=553468 RepID=A0A1N7B7S4_9EURY|nr:NAD-binding protein [Haladaptatus litoreus]SIR47354.1 voltage-gated potassium channel [Haladaptatus litoreus]
MVGGVRGKIVSARIVIWMTIGVALLSIATGLVSTGLSGTGANGGLYGGFVPEIVRTTASYTGTIAGFLLLVASFGLRRGFRIAWYASTLLVFLAAMHGILQSSPYSLFLVVGSLATLPLLIRLRHRFERPIEPTTTQIAAAAAVVGSQLYGTIGAYALQGYFDGIDGSDAIFEAFYFTVVTASTVGYGDIQPTRPFAQAFGMTVIVLGTGSFAVALGVLFTPMVENSFSSALGRTTNANIELMEDHILVLGYGQLLTEWILDELTSGDDYLLVIDDDSLVEELRSKKRNVIHGDPTDEELLERVGIDRAQSVLVATDDDADDALTVLTARQLNSDVRIVAGANDHENVKKFRRAGADIVVSPVFIGRMLVKAALGGEHVEELAEQLAGDRTNRTLDDF